MKHPVTLLLFLFALGTALMAEDSAKAAPTRTRASLLGAVASGMGKVMHMADFLKEYPGSRTAILAYVNLDSQDVDALVANLRINADTQERQGRDFWPQIALETGKLSLSAFTRELLRPGSQVDRS